MALIVNNLRNQSFGLTSSRTLFGSIVWRSASRPATSPTVDRMLESIASSGSAIDWKSFRAEKLSSNRSFSEKNFEVRLISLLVKDPQEIVKSKDCLRSLAEFVKQTKDIEDNPILAIHYCALLGRIGDKASCDAMRDLISRMARKYHDFLKYPLIDGCLVSLSSCCPTNCLFAVDIVNQRYEAISRSRSGPISVIVTNCLSFGLIEQAFHLFKRYETPLDEETALRVLSQPGIDHKYILEFFQFLNKSRTLLNFDSKQNLIDMLKALNFNVNETLIDRESGKCLNCETKLQTLTSEEINQLKESLDAKVLRREDIFLNTTPSEMKRFTQFIDSHRRDYFDLVVDGLNVSYRRNAVVYLDKKHRHEHRLVVTRKDTNIMSQTLVNVLRSAMPLFRRILVIGREHMRSWRSLDTFVERSRSQVQTFFIQNESLDDPFLLLAAVQSPKTRLMTNDFLRDHKHLLSDSGELLVRWAQCRQVRVSQGSLVVEIPQKYELRTNLSETHIHVPLMSSFGDVSWICAQNNGVTGSRD